MTFDTYQELAKHTARQTIGDEARINFALGIAEESGEVVGLIKKHIFHERAYSLDDMKKELGDLLWYLTMMAEAHGLTLEGVAMANIEKLSMRYPEKFVVGPGADR